MSKKILAIAIACGVSKIFENSKGELFTEHQNALNSESGKPTNVKIYEFTKAEIEAAKEDDGEAKKPAVKTAEEKAAETAKKAAEAAAKAAETAKK